jgi:hypothetical protein
VGAPYIRRRIDVKDNSRYHSSHHCFAKKEIIHIVNTIITQWRTIRSIQHTAKDKARVFESALGIALANDVLQTALRHAAASEDAIRKSNNGYGDVYELCFSLTTPKATATVLSVWIIRNRFGYPR